MAEAPISAAETQEFEALIDGLTADGFGLSDQFLSPEILAGLRAQLLDHHAGGGMSPAGIGQQQDFQRDATVRRDVIRWIEEDSRQPEEAWLNAKLDRFMAYLNRTCFTGLREREFHYAYYGPGSFYKRHIDQFRGDRGRKFSLVIYLNEAWTPTDGGQIALYLPEGPREVFPLGGRAVFFRSDELEHEVKASPERFRLSIAGWLKN